MPDSNPMPVRISPLKLSDDDNIVEFKNVSLKERKSLTAIQILSFKGKYTETAAAITSATGIECPVTAGKCADNEHTQVSWNGPNSWMVIASDEESGRTPGELLETLQKSIGDLAAIVDQSHGRCGLRLSGPKATQVMAKNTAIDLHPVSFNAGSCALTTVAHMNATVIQVDDTPTYDLFVARSLARSFAHAIEHSCAEFESE